MDFTFAVSWDLINPRRPQTLFAMKYSIDEKTEQVIKGKPTKVKLISLPLSSRTKTKPLILGVRCLLSACHKRGQHESTLIL